MTTLEADKLKAEINLMLAQMYEINEKMQKMNAETQKIRAEEKSIEAQTRKIIKETVFYPFVVAVGLVSAIAALVKIFF